MNFIQAGSADYFQFIRILDYTLTDQAYRWEYQLEKSLQQLSDFLGKGHTLKSPVFGGAEIY